MTERQGRESFEDALDSAIDALRAGRPLERVLSDHPAHASSLRDVLDTALLATADGGGYLPPSPRLAEHVTIVRAAAQRAQMSPLTTQPMTNPAARPPWWQRKLTFASLSVPVGIAVFALGASGAAAAAGVAAVTTDMPAQFARAAAPAWVEDAVPGLGHDNDGGSMANASPSATAEAGASETQGDETQTPGDINRPTPVEIAGVVSDIKGNTFTLTDGEDAWFVQIDAGTVIDGEIAEGGGAAVKGDKTADKNLHADEILVTAPAPAATEDDAKPDTTPRPEKTPGPPEDRTPPGPGAGQGSPESSGNVGTDSDSSGGGSDDQGQDDQ